MPGCGRCATEAATGPCLGRRHAAPSEAAGEQENVVGGRKWHTKLEATLTSSNVLFEVQWTTPPSCSPRWGERVRISR
eukprot:scaffold285613_cov32-Tisochrysis_lutea.AAC.1